jgi:hypothetical protein
MYWSSSLVIVGEVEQASAGLPDALFPSSPEKRPNRNGPSVTQIKKASAKASMEISQKRAVKRLFKCERLSLS